MCLLPHRHPPPPPPARAGDDLPVFLGVPCEIWLVFLRLPMQCSPLHAEKRKERERMKISAVTTRAIRFRLAPGCGSDAVHTSGLYGYAVCVLKTDSELEGHGIAFTLGMGTDIVERAIQHLAKELVGRDIEALMATFAVTFRALADAPALRWLGPHTGVIHLALAAITNACFDLWAKARTQPLHQLLLSLSDQQLLALVDLSYLEDVLTEAEAQDLIAQARKTRSSRESVLETGVPGYDTSCGWLSFSDDAIRQKVQESVQKGFKAVKLKVGGFNATDMERDLRRLELIRSVVGPDFLVALDANQRWTLPQALEICPRLARLNPLWIEEPTHPNDVAAHAEIAKLVAPIPVACGESLSNRVQFKNYFKANALQICQVDPTRVGGVAECLAVALMAKKFNIPVIPHVGDMGQISQHLVLVYHIAFDLPLQFLEFIPHLNCFFVDPAQVAEGKYVVPSKPGASSQLVPLPDGSVALERGGVLMTEEPEL
eukprot:m.166113 g.166113  ORF g.166113 m.166113 type:complete len:488 (+) comp21097_c1_seq3:1045-2508(+)